MSVGNSEGTRRCDAKCYHGKSKNCRCVCGGVNHGAGLQKALNNMRDHFLPELEKARLYISPGATVEIPDRIRNLAEMRRRRDRERANQLELFRRPLPAQRDLF